MRKRVIGGVGFVLLFYITLFMGLPFLLLLSAFLIAGIFELINMYKKSKVKLRVILYSISFIAFIFASGYLSIHNPELIMYITVLVMMDDTLAYAVGVNFGKTKLSKISPKKTVEGSIGGLLFSPISTIIIMNLVYILLSIIKFPFFTIDFNTFNNFNPFGSMLLLIVVSVGLAIIAQCGDLIESYFKRNSGIKDSGWIVYGHGGILDRVDSWIYPIILITIFVLVV